MLERNTLSVDYAIQTFGEVDFLTECAGDLVRGLSERNILVPTAYYYDDRGSVIFQKLCQEPSYYLPRAEKRLLEDYVEEIVRSIGPARLIELGCGDCHKSVVLLSRAKEHYGKCEFLPIDVSSYILRESCEMLTRRVPGIQINALAGRYEDAIAYVAALPPQRSVFLFLGSTMAQFTDDMITKFLTMLRQAAQQGDGFLVGFDLYKDPKVLSEPYNTAIADDHQWNALEFINKIFDGNFDTKSIKSEGRWNDVERRIEMTLTFKKAQNVELKALDFRKSFAVGEETITHIMRKMEPEDIKKIFLSNGMPLETCWIDRQDRFGLFLFRFK